MSELLRFPLDAASRFGPSDLRGQWVVDVGTGTGAIGLAIKSERPDARVVAIDVSGEALALARTNAGRLALDIDRNCFRTTRGQPPDLREERLKISAGRLIVKRALAPVTATLL